MENEKRDRRPIRLRENNRVRALAYWLRRAGMRPNQISILSVLFAGLSGLCLIVSVTADPKWRIALLVTAAAFIPLRGLCNLCDGLMAVEGGLKTRSGEIFNDLPDRISDSLLLVAAGYSINGASLGRELGWAAALLAVMTAYVRVLGGCAGGSQQFCGPMAKTHRMELVLAACLIAALEAGMGWNPRGMTLALGSMIIGSVITIVRRTYRIVKELETR